MYRKRTPVVSRCVLVQKWTPVVSRRVLLQKRTPVVIRMCTFTETDTEGGDPNGERGGADGRKGRGVGFLQRSRQHATQQSEGAARHTWSVSALGTCLLASFTPL